MCTTCGCGGEGARIEGSSHRHDHSHDSGHARDHHDHDHGHDHEHGHDPGRGHDHSHADGRPGDDGRSRLVRLEQDLLAKNDRFAGANRSRLADRGIFAVNLVSSPGSGKTTLLVRTIEALRPRLPIAVIEGDQQTHRDAARIRATGAPAVQINTGKGCHLDAHMVGHAMDRLAGESALPEGGILMIENVGNLVCPAAFDLGEAHKVAVLSVTEGEDKPIKYPDMFRAASLMLLNKCDLLPHLRFDVEAAIGYARRVNPAIEVIRVSAESGEGMASWCAWVEAGVAAARAAQAETMAGLRQRIADLERRIRESEDQEPRHTRSEQGRP